MPAERFRQVVDAEGPFASVYFDDSHDTEDAAKQWELTWRSLREPLEGDGAPDAVLAVLEKAVLDSPPAVGRSGRGVVAASDHVVLDEHLLRPPAQPETCCSAMPYLVPVIEHATATPYLLVAVDHEGADIRYVTPRAPRPFRNRRARRVSGAQGVQRRNRRLRRPSTCGRGGCSVIPRDPVCPTVLPTSVDFAACHDERHHCDEGGDSDEFHVHASTRFSSDEKWYGQGSSGSGYSTSLLTSNA